ncbi:hypothetical protein FJ364_04230 [Candidatus Dependentiae bacterium]|nr:hypothetical protein [Candidatus Dependentiae bacterium]
MKILRTVQVLSVVFFNLTSNIVADGIVYQSAVHNANQQIHVISVDIKQLYSLWLNHAVGDVCNREELSSMGLRHKPTVGFPVGSFHRGGRYNGCPKELLVMDSFVYSDAGLTKPTLLFNASDRTIGIKQQKMDWQVVIGDLTVPVQKVNQPITQDDEVVLYNAFFGRDTRTLASGLELVIERGKLIQVWSYWGNARIPSQGYVVHIGAEHPLATINWEAYLGASCKSLQTNSIDLLQDNVFAVQGLLMLVDQNNIVGNWEQQISAGNATKRLADEHGIELSDVIQRKVFLLNRQAYLALGLTSDQTLKIVAGMVTIDELAAYMKNLGCTTAMVASCGDDVALWFQDKLIRNNEEKEELPITTALLLFEHKPLDD